MAPLKGTPRRNIKQVLKVNDVIQGISCGSFAALSKEVAN